MDTWTDTGSGPGWGVKPPSATMKISEFLTMTNLTGREIWLEDEFGMIVGEITGIRAEGAYLVLTGKITTDEPESFTARIPITIEAQV